MQVLYFFEFFKQRLYQNLPEGFGLYIFSLKLNNENKQRLYKIQKRPTSLFYHVLLIKQNECTLRKIVSNFKIKKKKSKKL